MRYLCERLGELKACSKQWVLRRRDVCDEQTRMPEGSEFHIKETTTLKLREAKDVWTRGTDNRLGMHELGERGGVW